MSYILRIPVSWNKGVNFYPPFHLVRKMTRNAIFTSHVKILTNNFQPKELEDVMHEPKLMVAEDSFIGMGKGLGGRW